MLGNGPGQGKVRGTTKDLQLAVVIHLVLLPPINFYCLPAPGYRQGPGGHFIGYCRAGGNRRPISDFYRGDQVRVAANEYIVADFGAVFLLAIIIGSDDAATNIGIGPHRGVAHIGQMGDFVRSPIREFFISTLRGQGREEAVDRGDAAARRAGGPGARDRGGHRRNGCCARRDAPRAAGPVRRPPDGAEVERVTHLVARVGGARTRRRSSIVPARPDPDRPRHRLFALRPHSDRGSGRLRDRRGRSERDPTGHPPTSPAMAKALRPIPAGRSQERASTSGSRPVPKHSPGEAGR